jgi:hypothetical protein
MYLFCNSRIYVITIYSDHVCVYYASTLWCWYLVWILVRTDHQCLGVGYQSHPPRRLRHHRLEPGSRAPSSYQPTAALSCHNQFKSMKRLFTWTWHGSPSTAVHPSLHLDPPYFDIKRAPVASPRHLARTSKTFNSPSLRIVSFSPFTMNQRRHRQSPPPPHHFPITLQVSVYSIN